MNNTLPTNDLIRFGILDSNNSFIEYPLSVITLNFNAKFAKSF